MKTIILLSGLLLLIIYPAFSQQSDFPQIRQWSYSNQVDTALLKMFSDTRIDSILSATNSEHVYHLQGKFSSPERIRTEDNMPILKPKGNYPALMIKPDTTIRFTLLIKQP